MQSLAQSPIYRTPLRTPLRIGRRPRRGSIIATVLLFIALVLPVTLILLNTIQIETLLPANENLRLLALHEADKGFDAAITLLMQNTEEGTFIEIDIDDPFGPGTVPFPIPAVANPAMNPPDLPLTFGNAFGVLPYIGWRMADFTVPNIAYFAPFFNKGEHAIDSLVEPWARHPANDNYYLASRSVENRQLPANRDESGNIPAGDPDEYAAPERWVLTDVPIGMDDFSERTIRESRERLDTGFEPRGPIAPIGPSSPVPVDQPVNTGGGSFAGQPQGLPLDNGSNWAISPADPFFAQGNNGINYAPRPASYFRNNGGSDNSIEDSMTYDAWGDGIGVGDTNQYPDYPPLQQLVRASGWANLYFGGPVAAGDRANLEYKPAPGNITRYQLSSTAEGEALPGWYMSIVSDESGRFPINRLLNVIFQGGNYVYGDVDVPDGSGGTRTINGTLETPGFAPDRFDALGNATDLMHNDRHPNHYNYLLARDMLTSLFLGDKQIRDMDSGVINLQTEMENAQGKANWIIRQMLLKRAQMDRDFDGNGDGLDDVLSYRYRDGTILNNTTYDGNGRMGDSQHPQREGTWQVYQNPNDLLRDFAADGLFLAPVRDSGPGIGGIQQWFVRPSLEDFSRLHQSVTVYSYDTEYSADSENSTDLFQFPGLADRLDFNAISRDDQSNPFFSTFRVLAQQVGRRRAEALLRWRDGLVDLNGDGDLDDEYILLPTVDRSVFNGDPAEPHSQLTYRERNHPNFQSPAATASQRYQAYLNIASIGDMLVAPYNEPTEVLYADSLDASLTNAQMVQCDPAGLNPPVAVPNTNGPWDTTGARNGDLDPVSGGTRMLYFDGSGDAWTIDAPQGTNRVALGGGLFEGIHPSYAKSAPFVLPGTRPFVFQRMDTATPEIWIADQNTGAPLVGLPDNGLGLPQMTIGGGTALDLTDLAGPDWNPTNANEIAYSLGTGLTFNVFPPALVVQGDIYRYRLDIPIPAAARITNMRNDGTEGAFYPDYNPDGDAIVFTHIDLAGFSPVDPMGAFDLSIVDVATQGITRLNITYPDGQNRAEFMPVFSPSGDRIAFAAWDFDILTGNITSDIWIADATGGQAVRATNTAEFELYPIFTEGVARIARQSDTANGNTRGVTLPYPVGGISPVNTNNNRVLLAGILGEASLAFRDNDTSGLGAAQNWRFRDLPVTPQHSVEPLQALADQLSFRQPRSDVDSATRPRLQAYGGRININTAPRQVLRAIFLAMFQGARPNLDNTGLGRLASSTPRVRGSLLSENYLILTDSNTNLQDRFNALKIADQYAHQVVQYRKWLYNNQFLISDDTVPNGFTETDDELTGLHYRANPNLPYDSDFNPFTIERPRFDPAPPFRNVADLFRVALYFDYQNVTGQPSPDKDVRLYEAVEGARGPDRAAMPTAGTLQDNQTVATWTWGPIFQTDILTRYHGENAPGSGGTEILDPYETEPRLTRDADGNYDSTFALQQHYRLFSADDFRWIAPFLTVRSYVYRIESRGTIRVEAAQQYGNRMDITADKFWVVNTGKESVLNLTTTSGASYGYSFPIYSPVGTFSRDVLDQLPSGMQRNKRTRPYSIIAYQEQPENGVPLTRPDFLPTF